MKNIFKGLVLIGTIVIISGVFFSNSNLETAQAQMESLPLDSTSCPLVDVNGTAQHICTPIIDSQSPLPNGTVGTSYTPFSFTASSGTGTYTWAITSGALPLGLTLNGAVLSGTPTTSGTYSFVVTVTSAITASKQFSLTVDPASSGSLRVISPNGGEQWEMNQSPGVFKTISWSDPNYQAGNYYTVYLTNNYGGAYGIIANQVYGTKLVWTVGRLANGSFVSTGSEYYIQVVKQDGVGTSDQSDGAFGIVPTKDITIVPLPIMPSGTNISANDKMVLFLNFQINNPYNHDIKITNTGVYREGSATGSDFGTLYWYEEALVGTSNFGTDGPGSAGNMSRSSFISTDDQSCSPDCPALFVVPANSYKVIKVYADINSVISQSTVDAKFMLRDSVYLYTNDRLPISGFPVSGSLMTIVASSPSATITSSSLPNAKVGGAYSASLEATGEVDPYSWSIVSGSLPPGLNLQATDGKGCAFTSGTTTCVLISGTPSAAGTYTFTVNLSGKTDSASKQFTLTVDSETVTNQKPLGWLDSISKDGYISGWALDPDHLDLSISVHVYFDQPAGSGAGAMGTTTNLQREDVNLIMSATGTHGFQIAIPDNLRDGKSHTAYVYAIDVDDGFGVSNRQLYGSPKTFVLASITAQRHPRGTIVLGEGATVFFLGAEVRYPFPSPEVFFSWGHKFSDLVLANNADLAMPIGPVAQFNQ